MGSHYFLDHPCIQHFGMFPFFWNWEASDIWSQIRSRKILDNGHPNYIVSNHQYQENKEIGVLTLCTKVSEMISKILHTMIEELIQIFFPKLGSKMTDRATCCRHRKNGSFLSDIGGQIFNLQYRDQTCFFMHQCSSHPEGDANKPKVTGIFFVFSGVEIRAHFQ